MKGREVLGGCRSLLQRCLHCLLWSLQLWKGRWQGNDIIIKMLKIRDWTTRKSRDFNEEYPKLR